MPWDRNDWIIPSLAEEMVTVSVLTVPPSSVLVVQIPEFSLNMHRPEYRERLEAMKERFTSVVPEGVKVLYLDKEEGIAVVDKLGNNKVVGCPQCVKLRAENAELNRMLTELVHGRTGEK